MYSKRRQPRKQTKSRSGRRKTQRGGRFINVSDAVSTVRADLQTRQELPSRVDGLQATVDELQKQVADLKDNTATANDVATLQKRLDAIEQMLKNLNADFKMLLDVFTSNFHSREPPANYDAFKDIMSKQMRVIVTDRYIRGQSVKG